MKTVLEVKNLTKKFGYLGVSRTALVGIDLEVNEGEFLCIMGPSGAGKTTLLNIMSTIDQKTSGKIIFDGVDMDKIKDAELAKFRRNKIGFIFQDYNLLDNMTVEDNIALPLALEKLTAKQITEKVEQIADFLGIKDHLKKYPYQLSGGEQQRASTARAIITSPCVIFADEPTGALDSKAAIRLLEYLTKLNEEFKTTIIMVTHDAMSASYSKRVMFLKDGKIFAKLDKNDTRKEFFHRIMEHVEALGGIADEAI